MVAKPARAKTAEKVKPPPNQTCEAARPPHNRTAVATGQDTPPPNLSGEEVPES